MKWCIGARCKQRNSMLWYCRRTIEVFNLARTNARSLFENKEHVVGYTLWNYILRIDFRLLIDSL